MRHLEQEQVFLIKKYAKRVDIKKNQHVPSSGMNTKAYVASIDIVVIATSVLRHQTEVSLTPFKDLCLDFNPK